MFDAWFSGDSGELVALISDTFYLVEDAKVSITTDVDMMNGVRKGIGSFDQQKRIQTSQQTRRYLTLTLTVVSGDAIPSLYHNSLLRDTSLFLVTETHKLSCEGIMDTWECREEVVGHDIKIDALNYTVSER